MEKINFSNSLKNMPILPPLSYKLKLIEKFESIMRKMRWKAVFFLKNTIRFSKKNHNVYFDFELKNLNYKINLEAKEIAEKSQLLYTNPKLYRFKSP